MQGFWAKNAVQMTRSWIRGRIEGAVHHSRLEVGYPRSKPGFEGQGFYVWFDAPIGYISITAGYTDQWRSWWQNPDEVDLFQFIGKDNIPSILSFSLHVACNGKNWTMLHHMSSTEYLNYEGGSSPRAKESESSERCPGNRHSCDVWRFYMYYNRPASVAT